MDNLSNIGSLSKTEYNTEPVVYCKNCLSLKIRVLDDNIDYCDECGCTDTDMTDITSWEMMYEKKYNKPFNKK